MNFKNKVVNILGLSLASFFAIPTAAKAEAVVTEETIEEEANGLSAVNQEADLVEETEVLETPEKVQQEVEIEAEVEETETDLPEAEAEIAPESEAEVQPDENVDPSDNGSNAPPVEDELDEVEVEVEEETEDLDEPEELEDVEEKEAETTEEVVETTEVESEVPEDVEQSNGESKEEVTSEEKVETEKSSEVNELSDKEFADLQNFKKNAIKFNYDGATFYMARNLNLNNPNHPENTLISSDGGRVSWSFDELLDVQYYDYYDGNRSDIRERWALKRDKNGRFIICIEPGVPLNDAAHLNGTYQEIATTHEDMVLASVVAYWGYEVDKNMTNAMLTEQYVQSNFTAGRSDYNNHRVEFVEQAWKNRQSAFNRRMDEEVRKFQQDVSFHGQTINVVKGVGTTVTLTDTNNVLDRYAVSSSSANGISVSKSGNKLTLTISENASAGRIYFAYDIPTSYQGVPVLYIHNTGTGSAYGDYNKQNTMLPAIVVDPQSAFLNIVVSNPTVGTTATNQEDGSKVLDAQNSVTIRDRVEYAGVVAGEEYTVNGVLMDKETGNALLVNGQEVRASQTFTAGSANGTVDVLFTFNATGLNGKEVVVFEDLLFNGNVIASHRDINDAGQTVRFTNPSLETTATNEEDGSKVLDPLEEVVIRDEITYTDLIVGKEYRVDGVLMDKETGEALLVDGEEVRNTVTFTAEQSNGSIVMLFTLNANSLHGKTVVVFEDLYRNNTLLESHRDINDEAQTVTFTDPEIGTLAVNDEDDLKVIDALDEITLRDEVAYTGLIAGKEYELNGILMDKATGEALLVNGETVTNVVFFTPDSSNGTVNMLFTFDAQGLQGKNIVVFERLYRNGSLLTTHEDINDEGQTVRVTNPTLETTAVNDEDDLKVIDALKEVTIRDEIVYTDLIVGKEYTVDGVLMDKETGEALLVDGEEIRNSITFTATQSNGTIVMNFTLNAKSLQGKEVVVFEDLYRNNILLESHRDINDEAQTVRFTDPYLHTVATNDEDGLKIIDGLSNVTIRDEIAYYDVIAGKEYILEGYLMDKETGERLVIDGETFSDMIVFTPTASNGSVFMTFTLNASTLQGKEIVVFQDLYRNYGISLDTLLLLENREDVLAIIQEEGLLLEEHRDFNDAGQTVRFTDPTLETTAVNDEDELKEIDALSEVTIRDEIVYTDLIPGKEYTVEGVLMDKETGEPLLVDGEEVRNTVTFVPESPNGSIDMYFTLNASSLNGKTVVVFEDLYRRGELLESHRDINDEAQTVRFTDPELKTSAVNKEDSLKVIDGLSEITLVDTVEYTDLIVGKTYTISGVLMDKATEQPILVDGEEVRSSVTFVAETKNGTIDVEFTFDATAFQGQDIVVFETLLRRDEELAIHHDINDEAQTVHVNDNEIGTSVVNQDDGLKVVDPIGEHTFVDTVYYENLIEGKEYTVEGVLMLKSTGEALLIDGEEVRSSVTFIATGTNGTVEVPFTVDVKHLAGESIVVFEDLYRNGDLLAVHHDINDEDQTIRITDPEIGTQARNEFDGKQVVLPLENNTIVDTVSYTDLIVGKEYTIKGWIMVKETGERLLIDGEPVLGETTFIAESENGTVDVIFNVNTKDLAGLTIVVFEELYRDGVLLAEHKDINDEGQSIKITSPKIGTEASVDGAKEVYAQGEVTITDTVSYEGLVPGREYVIKGWLMDKETGEPLLINGEMITAEKRFIPDSPNGTVDVEFYIADASSLAGKTIVVFEELYVVNDDGELELIAEHKDINDEAQTVYFKEVPEVPEEPEEPELPKTGSNNSNSLIVIGSMITMLGLAIVVYSKKELNERNDF